jgi:hypothetical protein
MPSHAGQYAIADTGLALTMICRYKFSMTKAQLKKEPTGKWVVRDSRSGHFIEVRGADSLKSSKLPLKKGIDLTKPIAKQALRGGPKMPKRSVKG